MPRYGGGKESFEEQERRIAAMKDRVTSLEGKEASVAKATDDMGAADQRATTKRQTYNKAKSEGADITAREKAVINEETQAVEVNTASIEANRIARQRAAEAARQQAIDVGRAFRGAGDPLFAQATASGATSQYGLRNALGIGQGRAARLQEAIRASFLTPGNAGAARPVSDVTGAQVALVASERELTQANRTLANLKRRSTAVSEEEMLAAVEAKNAAQREVAASKQQLTFAEQLAAARHDDAIALQREAEAAVVQVTRVPGGPGKGTAIIQHPTEFVGGRNVPTSDYVGRQIAQGIEATRAEALAVTAAEESRAAIASAQRAEAVAAEEKALAGLTAGERAYIATLDSATAREKIDSAVKARNRANVARGEIGAAAAANAGSVQREGAAYSAVNQEMQKHGALTQEFVLAASRGEVTLRELGNQALVTAGKFGGWTAAATAVFGVARALGSVVKGAVQAQSAQANLSRFIPGQTQDVTSAGLVQVSREVNAPIEDVSQTQQVFARVFKNQNDSLTATSTALKAYKLDQIDAADSTRYFTAITQEFGLNANQLPGLFDQISAAQRRMGARVSETLPAIARSAAAVKNAGGDLTQLVALTATAQVASGQTGNVVGTAFSRAAANFSRKPENQKVIESFGINAHQSFTQMLIDAVRRSQTLSGAQRTELAKAIGGPQYGGRIFQSLLGQQDRLTGALGIVNPANAAGSANEELRKKLQGVDEMVKRLGTDLQQLGVELAQAGAFDLAGLLLKGTDQLLHAVTELLSLYNDIPKPLRETLTILGEMVVAVKLLQRFAPASLLNSGVGRAIGGPELGLRQRTLRGLRGTSSELANDAERLQLTSSRATNAADRARIQAERAVTENDRLRAEAEAGNIEAAKELEASDRAVVKANGTYERARGRATLAEQEAADASLQAASADIAYAEARKLSTADLKALGVYSPNKLGTPNYEGVSRNSDGRPRIGPNGAVLPPGQMQFAGMEDADKIAAQEAKTVEGRADRARLAVSNWATSWRAGAGNLEESSVLMGRTVAAGTTAVERGANVGIAASEKVAAGLTGAGRSIGALAASLGPLDIAIVGFIGITILGDKLKKLQEDFDKTAASVTEATPTRASLSAHRRSVAALAKLHGETAGQTFQHIAEDLNPINLFSDVTGIGGYQSPYERQLSQVTAPARQEQSRLRLIKRLQDRAEARGSAIPQQTYDQLQRRIDVDATLRQEGVISLREFDRRMALHAIEAKTLLDPTSKDVHAARQALTDANIRAPGRGYADSLSALGGKQLADQATAITDQMTDLGPTRIDFEHLAAVYRHQRALYSGNSTVGIEALSSARQAYYKAITDTVQSELKVATGAGSTEAGRQAAYARAASQYRRHILGEARDQQAATAAKLRAAEAAQRVAQDAVKGSSPDNAFGLGSLGLLPGENSDALEAAADAARKRVRHLKDALGHANDNVRAAERQTRLLLADLRDSRYGDRQGSRQTDLSLLQSASPNDPVKQAREAIAEAQQQVNDAVRTYGPGHTDAWKQAVTALNNARTGLTQAIDSNASDIINAETALAQSRTNDPLTQARIAEAGARRLLGVAHTRLQRLQALAAINNASQQVQDAIKAQTDAHFSLLESLTTDPVTIANLERRRARSDIAGTSGVNRLTAKADYNKAIQAQRDARLQSREDDIDFERTMGQITIQDAVARYQTLLHIRNLTKQQRRDIELKIHQLQGESDSEASGFNLDIGNFKLPTLFDVRKALAPLHHQAHDMRAAAFRAQADISSNVSHMYDARSQVQATINIEVNDKHAAHEVYSAIDRALGTSVRARMRSRGLRG